MKVQGTSLIFSLLIVAVLFIGVKTDDEQQYQDALHNLILRLGSSGHNNCGSMPSTFSVDIVSLVRWAVEQQHVMNTSKGQQRSSFQSRKVNTSVPTEYFYPKEFLSLVKFNEKSYFISRNQIFTFVEAMSFCRAYGMDLVSVETKEENEFLVQQLINLGLTQKYVWTSGHKIGRSAMMWSNGEQIIYEDWDATEPSAPLTQFCLIFYKKKWHDLPCDDHKGYFVCEERL